jgi:hypothetical protein
MAKVKLTPIEVADAWAFYTIKIWKEKMRKLRISQSGRLDTSFLKNVVGTPQGGVISIQFSFLYYGKFVDMGVGRGVKIGDVSENKISRRLEGRMLGNRRRPKKWYGKTFYAEVSTLKEILVKEYAHKGVLQIVENLNDHSIH